ncbi:MAG: shikimate kinase [Anaerovoracaceae bacterium]
MNYGLIGEKLGHSYSELIHKLLGNSEYELKEIQRNFLEDFFAKREFKGINVTIPYKEEALELCDEVDELARRIGCVNTVINIDGKLCGYNTDYFGLKYLIESKMAVSLNSNLEKETLKKKGETAKPLLENKKVLILGDGGTSKTARVVAEDLGAREIIIASRKVGFVNYSEINKLKDINIVINTTPVGMYPNNQGRIIDLNSFEKLTAVFDVIFNPLKTNIILQAQDLGITAAGGLGMLVAQAVYANEIFETTRHNEAKLNKEVENILGIITNQLKNIVIIGMPGVGKTTFGKTLANKLRKKFFDSDNEIEKITEMKPEEIINTKGEKYFRDIEAKVILELSKSNGSIIATGGGSILREENRNALRQNGHIIYLKTENFGALSTKGRPLSKNIEELEKLYARRKELYESLADEFIQL